MVLGNPRKQRHEYIQGSPRYCFFYAGRSRAGFNIHGTPRHVLGGIQHPRNITGPDPLLAGIHGRFWAGRSILGTPQNGTHVSRDYAGYFARDSVIARLYGIFGAGDSKHGAPQ